MKWQHEVARLHAGVEFPLKPKWIAQKHLERLGGKNLRFDHLDMHGRPGRFRVALQLRELHRNIVDVWVRRLRRLAGINQVRL